MTRYRDITYWVPCQERPRVGARLQVSFDPAALFDACEINHEISLDKYGIKRSRKSYSTNICHSSPYFYFHVKMISHYASVNFFLTHTVELSIIFIATFCKVWEHCGVVVRAFELQLEGRGFDSHSAHVPLDKAFYPQLSLLTQV